MIPDKIRQELDWLKERLNKLEPHINTLINPSSGGHTHVEAEITDLAHTTDTDTTDHTALTNIGTNTHAQIDSHIAAANPHSGSAPTSHSHTESDISDLDHDIAAASTTVAGKVELATGVEAAALTDTARAITPSALASVEPNNLATPTASLGMGSQQIKNLANATASGDAVNKSQLDGKSDTSHNHDASYAAASHNHTESQITDLDHDAVKIQGVNVDSSVGTPSDGDILVYRTLGSDFVLESKPVASGDPAWGDITGTLSNQTDLQSALDGKSATSHSHTIDTADLADGAATADKIDLGPSSAHVSTDESRASSSYGNLSTTTDTVTVTIGANGIALVNIVSGIYNGTGVKFVSVDISGASTISASTNESNGRIIRSAASGAYVFGASFIITGLTAGSTTFKLKYRVTSGTGRFFNRSISVVPL